MADFDLSHLALDHVEVKGLAGFVNSQSFTNTPQTDVLAFAKVKLPRVGQVQHLLLPNPERAAVSSFLRGLILDVPDDFDARCRKTLEWIREVALQMENLLTRNIIFTRRFKDVGTFSKEDALSYGWFDFFLKGESNKTFETMPKVRYFMMGMNKWQTSETWPPQGAQPMTLFLAGGGKAKRW